MKTIVLPPRDTDIDGIACAVAYAELLNASGTVALPWFTGSPDAEALFHIHRNPQVTYASEHDVNEAKSFVFVDASGLELLPPQVAPSAVVEVIDHRFIGNPHEHFANAKICLERVGAAATMIVERFREAGITPTLVSSEMLFGAIHSNTQCLKGSITDARDGIAIAWLESCHQFSPELLNSQFLARKEEITADIETALKRERKTFQHPSGLYAIAQFEFWGAVPYFNEHAEFFTHAVPELSPRTMLNVVDLQTGGSLLFIPDGTLRELASQRLNTEFVNGVAEFPKVVLRKQIASALEIKAT